MTTADMISLEEGTWYYFSVDLDLEGFASLQFVRYVDVNHDRAGAIVRFLDRDYFSSEDLLLLPYSRKANYFRASADEILSVRTFDASKIGSAATVDLKSEWPNNILDKAAITPSVDTAIRWTEPRNAR